MFKCNENITSYKLPIFKIILCCLSIVLIVSRNYFIRISNSLWNTVVSIVCLLIGVLSVLCIYLSASEMLLLSERRDATKLDIENAIKFSKNYSVDNILALLEKNDIIEFAVISDNQIIKLGASSDCRPGNSHFFDKTYYINDHYELSIEEMKDRLKSYSIEGKICVITIDSEAP